MGRSHQKPNQFGCSVPNKTSHQQSKKKSSQFNWLLLAIVFAAFSMLFGIYELLRYLCKKFIPVPGRNPDYEMHQMDVMREGIQRNAQWINNNEPIQNGSVPSQDNVMRRQAAE
ncbi:hypothetical protein CDAR_428671 [Caerostris darwini]|uniref:Uncharacterized protein n=1 Tax=Caerostris darwini TaxID=1538125 RepID=A0AAV4TSH1_9ARAC|nr:hypothetical protein CDAR_428671 [Caerostris darwini]